MTQDAQDRESSRQSDTTQQSVGWQDRCIVIVGMTGVGKSTIGTHLARELDRKFVDLDQYIVDNTGRPVSQIFNEKGEQGFRQLEAKALAECLALGADVVLSTGGGAVVTETNRTLLTQGPLVLWLQADLDDLVHRTSHEAERPLLAGDARGVLQQLMSDRDDWYRQVADLSIVTTGQHIPDVVASLSSLIRSSDGEEAESSHGAGPVPMQEREQPASSDATLIVEHVQLDHGRSYPVLVGPGARQELAALIPDGVERVALVTQRGIDVAVDPGVDHQVFMVEAGERAKRMSVVEDLARSFAQWGMTRDDMVVAVGGGVVTDLGGFVASTYHRGIKVIHVSTTLLGQIDAAIGGKCGVNLPEGKNLVGAFWQPTAVICDTDTLSTLPSREFRSGLGELAKYHFLGESGHGQPLDELTLAERVAACVRIKADVVADDEREGGRRAILNYGHTLGHALETASAEKAQGVYGIRHGEGVAIGLIYAAELAKALGRIDQSRVDEHRRVVQGYELATELPEGSDCESLVQLFKRDKKAARGITFVLDGPDGVEPVGIEDEGLLLDCLHRMNES